METFKTILWMSLVMSMFLVGVDERFLGVAGCLALVTWFIHKMESENEKWEMKLEIDRLKRQVEMLRKDIDYLDRKRMI